MRRIAIAALTTAALGGCGPRASDAPKPPLPPPSTTAGIKAVRCPADGLAAFPDPVPRASVVAGIPRALLLGAAESMTLRQLARRLEAVLLQAEFRQMSYLGYKCDGFALVADLERIQADGTPFDGDDRFGPSTQAETFNLATYIQRLFFAPPGYYRQIVFLVTDEQIRESADLPTEGRLKAIGERGAEDLPFAYDRVNFEPRHRVRALIYEFEKGPGDQQARMIDPDGRLGGTVHLSKAKIYRAFEATTPAP